MTAAAKILFVDDEKQMLTALNRVFRANNYIVFTANSGQEALNILETETMDVIVSDMRMPEMDGAAFLAKTVDLNPNSRRILLTGYSDQESTVRAINAINFLTGNDAAETGLTIATDGAVHP